METIRVLVGSVTISSAGVEIDTTRQVEFIGQKLAEHHAAATREGQITAAHGRTETLYRSQDGRLIVHIHDWSHWRDEPNTYTLLEVTVADLQEDGRFAALGREAGLGRPLTLDEGLAYSAGATGEEDELWNG